MHAHVFEEAALREKKRTPQHFSALSTGAAHDRHWGKIRQTLPSDIPDIGGTPRPSAESDFSEWQ